MTFRPFLLSLFAVAALGACSPAPTQEVTERGDVLPATRAKGRIVMAGVDLHTPINALGVEPFWGLEIRPAGMRLAGLDRPDLLAPNHGPVLVGGKAVWEATTDVGAPIKVELSAEPCSDGLSARAYPLSARIDFAGDVLNGCAGPRQFVVESSWRGR